MLQIGYKRAVALRIAQGMIYLEINLVEGLFRTLDQRRCHSKLVGIRSLKLNSLSFNLEAIVVHAIRTLEHTVQILLMVEIIQERAYRLIKTTPRKHRASSDIQMIRIYSFKLIISQ